ncbi:hypothetical protein QTV49_004623 [Vibrio vulnificus]|nr:hypothetical protein [Vibrio vulnificus]
MFSRIKAIFGGSKIKDEHEKAHGFVDYSKTATLGIDIGKRITVEYPVLDLYDNVQFSLGSSLKKVTGISRNKDGSDHSLRAYTEDDYFLQIDYFGEDSLENLQQIILMGYQLDDGDHFRVYTDEELGSYSEDQMEHVSKELEKAKKWQNIIDFAKEYEFRGNTYCRENEVTMGGQEVVELLGDEVNALENNFSIFSRKIAEEIHEVLIINAEQGLIVNDSNVIVGQEDTVTVSIALGLVVSHTNVKVNHHTGA